MVGAFAFAVRLLGKKTRRHFGGRERASGTGGRERRRDSPDRRTGLHFPFKLKEEKDWRRGREGGRAGGRERTWERETRLRSRLLLALQTEETGSRAREIDGLLCSLRRHPSSYVYVIGVTRARFRLSDSPVTSQSRQPPLTLEWSDVNAHRATLQHYYHVLSDAWTCLRHFSLVIRERGRERKWFH